MIRRLLLWDLDGTLLRAGAVSAGAFDLAVQDVLGRETVERIRFSGKTDPQIVTEQLRHLDVVPTPELVERVLARLEVRMAEAADRLAESSTACIGVPELLAALAGRGDVCNGVLTGNLRANALVKLDAVGLAGLLDTDAAAYGSDSYERDRLVPIAMARAEQRGIEVEPEDTWVIGDTPRDLWCARAGGVRALLVATGGYTLEQLAALGPDAAVEDLSDTAAMAELLAGEAAA